MVSRFCILLILFATVTAGSWHLLHDDVPRTQEVNVYELRETLGGTGSLLSDDVIQELVDRGISAPTGIERKNHVSI